MYWFAHKAYSAVIHGWIQQCLKQLKNWWLTDSEICLVAIPYMFPPFLNMFPHVSPTVFPVYLGISHVSPGVSPSYFRSYKLSHFWSFTNLTLPVIIWEWQESLKGKFPQLHRVLETCGKIIFNRNFLKFNEKSLMAKGYWKMLFYNFIPYV